MKTILLILTLSSILSTPLMANEMNEKKDRKAVDSLVQATNKLAALDLSCSTKNDCALYSTGKRACGGPNGFIVTSKNNLLIDEVEYLAAQSEIQEAAYNQRYGVVSICSMVMKPMVACEKNICK